MPAPDVPPVLVSVGFIPPDSLDGEVKDGDTSAVWGDYLIINRYHDNRGKYMMGMTSPEGFGNEGNRDTVAFVQLHSPTLLWIMDWTVKRSKLEPKIPNPNLNDPDWVLLDRIPINRSVDLHPDGQTPIYRISGTYVYGHRRPNEDTIKNIAIPRPAWLERSAANWRLSRAAYEDGLGDPNERVLSTAPGVPGIP